MAGLTGEFCIAFDAEGGVGRAHVRVWRQDRGWRFAPNGDRLLIIVTAIEGEAAEQLGLPPCAASIQPAFEQLLETLCASYGVAPLYVQYAEHWSPRGAHTASGWEIPETWFWVHFRLNGRGRRGGTRWERQPRAVIEQMIGFPWEDAIHV